MISRRALVVGATGLLWAQDSRARPLIAGGEPPVRLTPVGGKGLPRR